MDSSSRSNNNLQIPYEQVERVTKLLGDATKQDVDLSSRKRTLMQGLSDLINADGWLWSATQVIREQNRPISSGVIYGGLTEKQFNGWVEASQIASEQPPEDEPLTVLLKKGEHFTRTRQQVVSDAIWYNHPAVKQYRLKNGIDHFLYSIYPIGSHHCSAIGFFRHVGREPFDDPQRRICHLVVSSIEHLHYASFPERQCKNCIGLSKRQRTVLIHLLHGKSREEIANLLGISVDTAKSHIRSIYRHFRVDSQVKLMHCFYTGNGPSVALSIED